MPIVIEMTVFGDLYHCKAGASILYEHHRICCTGTHSIPQGCFRVPPHPQDGQGGRDTSSMGEGMASVTPSHGDIDGEEGVGRLRRSGSVGRSDSGSLLLVCQCGNGGYSHRFFSPRFSLVVIYTPHIFGVFFAEFPVTRVYTRKTVYDPSVLMCYSLLSPRGLPRPRFVPALFYQLADCFQILHLPLGSLLLFSFVLSTSSPVVFLQQGDVQRTCRCGRTVGAGADALRACLPMVYPHGSRRARRGRKPGREPP